MGTGFMIRSTAHITWDEFYNYAHSAFMQLGLTEIEVNPDDKNVWFALNGTKPQFHFSLINQGDDNEFLIQQERDELHLPFETGITVGVRFGESPDQLALQLLCALGEKWPIIVDNSGGGNSLKYYNNDELLQRLYNGENFFPRST